MEAVYHPRIKICCISSVEEATLAIAYGASAVGLVSAMPSGPGPITEDRIAEIARTIPPPIASFLLTCLQDGRSIIAQQKKCRTNCLQLVDRVEEGAYGQLRAALPGISIVQVIHVTGEQSLDEALSVEPFVDALLLDSGRPDLPVKELGGTGRVHDWRVSRAIREAVQKPIFLAGGMSADNVERAIAEVSPFGIDLCSSVRTNGSLDESKLARFFDALRSSVSPNR